MLDAAQKITAARCGVISPFADSGDHDQFLAAGLTPKQSQDLSATFGGFEVLDHLRRLPGPIRAPDFPGYIRSLALPDFNARRNRDEQRARTDLEAQVNAAPVGVVLFDARTGLPLWLNSEAERIVGTLQEPGQPPEQLLNVVTVQRADGGEVALHEAGAAQALSTRKLCRPKRLSCRSRTEQRSPP